MKFSYPPPKRGPWMMAGGQAVGIHASVFAAFLLDIPFTPRTETPPAMAIEVAMLPVAPPVPKSQMAVGPDQVEAPEPRPQPKEEVKKLPFEAPPELKVPNLKPDVVIAKQAGEKVEKKEQTQPPALLTTQQAALDLPPDRKLQAVATGGISSGADKPAEAWEAQILAKLQQMKRYPSAAMARREQDLIYARIVIDRKGKVLSANIERSRGYRLLDDEVRDLVRRASPLPAPPPEVEGDTIELVVPAEFFIRKKR